MCGIVGHLGSQNSVEIVLEGLRRLEYRGYDSAGVCYRDNSDQLILKKKEGRLDNLKNLLGSDVRVSHMCIGHTRWATHGEVNDTNAHPHLHESIAIVHNGIIENASELRKELTAEGIVFHSQTDTEVFLALLVIAQRSGLSLQESVTNSFKRIKGNSAFVVVNKDKDVMMAIKRGAPLVCGVNTNSNDVVVSSDPYALVGVADQLYFPEDEVLCRLATKENTGSIHFYELDGSKSDRLLAKAQDMTLSASEKGEFEHYMLKEIYEQPDLIRSLAQYYGRAEGLEKLVQAGSVKPSRIQMVACGTAWHAGLVIRDFIEKRNAIPCSVELASEFRYRNPIIESKDLGLFISQSGETADTLAAQQLCAEKSIRTLGVVNVEGSTLSRDCDDTLYIRAGVEIGVASTKAFTQQALTGWLLSQSYSGEINSEEAKKKFYLLADRLDSLLENIDTIKSIAEKIYNAKGFIFTGRGVYFPIALEGALKLKEIAYVHAEGYAAGELKHGPIALIDEEMVNIAIVGPELFDKTLSNIEEVKARRGIIVTLGEEGQEELERVGTYNIPLNFEGLDDLAPLYVNVANQLLAYYMAKFKGTDIDKPRNLAKSVTVE